MAIVIDGTKTAARRAAKMAAQGKTPAQAPQAEAPKEPKKPKAPVATVPPPAPALSAEVLAIARAAADRIIAYDKLSPEEEKIIATTGISRESYCAGRAARIHVAPGWAK